MDRSNESQMTRALNAIRRDIKAVAASTKSLAGTVKARTHPAGDQEDTGELAANLMITYRHLEDASMRLGKAIQAHDGGVSVYDKETTVGAPAEDSGQQG